MSYKVLSFIPQFFAARKESTFAKQNLTGIELLIASGLLDSAKADNFHAESTQEGLNELDYLGKSNKDILLPLAEAKKAVDEIENKLTGKKPKSPNEMESLQKQLKTNEEKYIAIKISIPNNILFDMHRVLITGKKAPQL